MSRPGVIAMVLLGTTLTVAGSDAAVLCRAGSGRLALREQCRKAEQPVDPSQLDLSAIAGPQGGPGGAGPRGRHPLKIVDSSDSEIGPIESLGLRGGTAWVAVTHPALLETVFFLLYGQGFVRSQGGSIATVYYVAADCAGVPYIQVFSRYQTVAQVYGDSAYYETGVAASRSYGSTERDPLTPCGGVVTSRGTCCLNDSGTATIAPAVRVPVADLGFVPPFRAVLR
jgi:hypothetical protein